MTNTIDLSSETGRERVGLSGYWRFKTDLEERGEGQAWFKGSGENWDILHVPGNWNEQVPDYTS